MTFKLSHCMSARIALSTVAGLALITTYYCLKYYQNWRIELHNLEPSSTEYNVRIFTTITIESFYAIFILLANFRYFLNEIILFYNNKYKSMIVIFLYFLLLGVSSKWSISEKNVSYRFIIRDVIFYPFFEEFFFRHVLFQNLKYGMVGIERIWIMNNEPGDLKADTSSVTHTDDRSDVTLSTRVAGTTIKNNIVHRKLIVKDLNTYTVLETADITFLLVIIYFAVISSILFATAHHFYDVILINDYIYRVISGIFYTIFVDLTHNLLVSLICHSVHNLFVLKCQSDEK
ncbi:putative Abortive infection protein [Trachipleistophora hominis]|uniref:Putative Abortive infection protein n=1 Tax=Trachipleistophora hominis TaxID=72359 RepID=L7JRM7_TRAHO|nr:putative Abortive infection protein [Trachipleistophora hominis]